MWFLEQQTDAGWVFFGSDSTETFEPEEYLARMQREFPDKELRIAQAGSASLLDAPWVPQCLGFVLEATPLIPGHLEPVLAPLPALVPVQISPLVVPPVAKPVAMTPVSTGKPTLEQVLYLRMGFNPA